MPALNREHLDQVTVGLAAQLRQWVQGVESVTRGTNGLTTADYTLMGYNAAEATVIADALYALNIAAGGLGAYTTQIYKLLGID